MPHIPTFKTGQYSPFYPNSAKQFAWDATSLTTFMKCPKKYELFMLRQLTRKGSAKKDLRFGTLYHGALELYDRCIADNKPHEIAQREMVHYCLLNTWDDRDENGEGGHPWYSGNEPQTNDPYKNRETLVRAVVWYTEHFINDNMKTLILSNGKPAVEYTFKLDIGDDLLYCGHLDKVAEMGGLNFISDKKTTKNTPGQYYFDQFDLNVQMSGYAMAGKMIFDIPIRGVIIDVCQLMVNSVRFERRPTMRTEEQIVEWLKNAKTHIKHAHQCADEDHFPMCETSCMDYGGCEFRAICSADPRIRESIINSDFERKEWNPLEAR